MICGANDTKEGFCGVCVLFVQPDLSIVMPSNPTINYIAHVSCLFVPGIRYTP